MAQTVIGFFDNASEAQQAAERLQSVGISRDRVDVSRGGSGTVAGSAGTAGVNPVSGSPKDDNTVRTTSDDRTVDSEGRNTNAFTDFFNNLFGSSDDKSDADRYNKVAQGSNTIVTVHAQSREEAERAADILDECGAVDVDERSAQYGSAGTGRSESSSHDRETTIPRIEENLEVGKRTEERGGVRVRSRIVERPVEEHVRLREEHIHIDRQPADRPVSMDDTNAFQEREIELTESSEVPVVNKEARVVEEIRLTKDVTERDETIQENVRSTEVDIDNIDESARRTDRDTDATNRSL
jgi:stress response protein YsnF